MFSLLFGLILGLHLLMPREYSYFNVWEGHSLWCSEDHRMPGFKLRPPTCKAFAYSFLWAISLTYCVSFSYFLFLPTPFLFLSPYLLSPCYCSLPLHCLLFSLSSHMFSSLLFLCDPLFWLASSGCTLKFGNQGFVVTLGNAAGTLQASNSALLSARQFPYSLY